MKLKKLKKLLAAINDLTKIPISEVKGIQKTPVMLDDTHPLLLLPTRGKYCIEPIRRINHIIRSIEPTKLVDEARKVNLQTGMKVLSVYETTKDAQYKTLFVHTPYGCCAYNVMIDKDEVTKEVLDKNLTVEIQDDDLNDKFEIL